MTRLVYVNPGLEVGPSILKALVAQIDPLRYDDRLSPDRFTLREVVAHMADMEPVMLARMELALANPGAPVQNWDQDKEAAEKNYAAWDVAESVKAFGNARAETFALFDTLTEEQLRLTMNHSLLGELSIFDLGVFVLGHDVYHFDQLAQYLPGLGGKADIG